MDPPKKLTPPKFTLYDGKSDPRHNPMFDQSNNEVGDALEENLPLVTIHMIEGPNHPDLEN